MYRQIDCDRYAADPKRTSLGYHNLKAGAGMKLFGYEEGNHAQGALLTLCEASILASPAELRAIAKVLADLAVEMEAAGFDHVHLTDRLPSLADGPELIVAKAR